MKKDICIAIMDKIVDISNILELYSVRKRTYGEDGKNYYKNEMHILEIIVENPDFSPSDIAKKLFKTRSSISQMLKKLVKKDLIYSVINNSDQRSLTYVPTENGKELYLAHKQFDKNMADLLRVEFKDYSNTELELFLEMLKKFYKFQQKII
ncbi:MAG: MarR family winged helix-turn-helix transcriptional regulator [Cetobacterium sp.]